MTFNYLLVSFHIFFLFFFFKRIESPIVWVREFKFFRLDFYPEDAKLFANAMLRSVSMAAIEHQVWSSAWTRHGTYMRP